MKGSWIICMVAVWKWEYRRKPASLRFHCKICLLCHICLLNNVCLKCCSTWWLNDKYWLAIFHRFAQACLRAISMLILSLLPSRLRLSRQTAETSAAEAGREGGRKKKGALMPSGLQQGVATTTPDTTFVYHQNCTWGNKSLLLWSEAIDYG